MSRACALSGIAMGRLIDALANECVVALNKGFPSVKRNLGGFGILEVAEI